MLSALATSSSSVLPFKSVLRFCSDCFVNLAPSYSTVPQVVVGMVTGAAAEAASICANLLVVYCRRDSSLPLSTLNSAFRRRSLDSSSWIQPALASKTFKIDSTASGCRSVSVEILPSTNACTVQSEEFMTLVPSFLHRMISGHLPSQNSLAPHQVVCREPRKRGRFRNIPLSRRMTRGSGPAIQILPRVP